MRRISDEYIVNDCGVFYYGRCLKIRGCVQPLIFIGSGFCALLAMNGGL